MGWALVGTTVIVVVVVAAIIASLMAIVTHKSTHKRRSHHDGNSGFCRIARITTTAVTSTIIRISAGRKKSAESNKSTGKNPMFFHNTMYDGTSCDLFENFPCLYESAVLSSGKEVRNGIVNTSNPATASAIVHSYNYDAPAATR